MANNLKALDFAPSKEELAALDKETKRAVKSLKAALKKAGINAQIFLGGSFAKGTMVKKSSYDIDIFVRIDKRKFEKDLKTLPKAVETMAKSLGLQVATLHGSRDYYQIALKDKNAVLEIIPVLKVRRPEEAENVTDLSYFHVDYIRKKVKAKMQREVRIAKAFFDACNTYGAESYIQGFSGYATECLIAAYGSFQKMLKALTKEGKIIVDPARHYRNPKEALIDLNEAKLQSPVIVIDPTWKKRNALASLSQETFDRFKKHALSFLKNPTVAHFEVKQVSKDELQAKAAKIGAEFVEIELQTDRQEGDIAGTKMKKASRFIVREAAKAFTIIRDEFVYDMQQSSMLYIIAKPIKELVFPGPPLKLKKHADAFKNEHPTAFEKRGRLYATRKNEQTLKQYLESKILNGKEIKSMGITSAKVI